MSRSSRSSKCECKSVFGTGMYENHFQLQGAPKDWRAQGSLEALVLQRSFEGRCSTEAGHTSRLCLQQLVLQFNQDDAARDRRIVCTTFGAQLLPERSASSSACRPQRFPLVSWRLCAKLLQNLSSPRMPFVMLMQHPTGRSGA